MLKLTLSFLRRTLMCPALLFFCVSTINAQTTFYVKATSSGSADGSSWANASSNLQNIINSAASGDQVWVAAGTYLPTRNAFGNVSSDRSRTFLLKNGVKLYGGFAGTETTLNQRNYATNVITLSGDFNGDDGANFSNYTENAYNVVVGLSVSNTTEFDGFTISHGNANGNYFFISGQIIINGAGGGMYCTNSQLALANLIFTDNYGNEGGAVQNNTSIGTVNYTNCSFTNNKAFYDGALYNYQTTSTLTNCIISGNSSIYNCGAVYGFYNAITMNNCVLSNNTCTSGSGGAILMRQCAYTANNTLFVNNSAVYGGAIANGGDNPSFSINNCTFYSNSATTNGKCISSNAGTNVNNSIFWGSTGNGAEIYGFNAGTISVNYSVVVTGTSDFSGSNNVSGDPKFENASNTIGSDGIWRTVDDGLMIGCGSSAYNTGNNSIATITDIIGTIRPVFTTADRGAYESTTNLSSTSSSANITICPSQLPYNWNGYTFNAAGSQTATLTNSGGCDSIVTLNVTVGSSSTSSTTTSACDSLRWNGITYTTSGTYTYSTTNAVGCDSTATLNLIIKNSSTSITNAIICNNQLPHSWNGLTIPTAGSHTAHLINAVGCDSAATLNLSVNVTSSSTSNITICSNLLPYSWNGLTFSTAGSQTAHFSNAVGCDSAATLNLTVNQQPNAGADITVCAGSNTISTLYIGAYAYAYELAGNPLGVSNFYAIGGSGNYHIDFASNVNGVYGFVQMLKGCTDTMFITVNSNSTSSTTTTACDSLVWNGTTYTTSGTYTYSTTNAVGCDSTATLNLTINASSTLTLTTTVCDSLIWNGTIYRNNGTYAAHFTNAVGCDSTAILILTVNYKPTVAPIVGLTNIEILAIGGGGGAGGPDGALGAGGGAGGAVYGNYTLSTTGSSIYTVGVGGAGGYGQGCAGNAAGGTAGANGGATGGNAGTGGCSGGGGGSGGWSGLYQGSNFIVVAGGGAGGGGSNEGTANDVTTPGGGNQSAANGTSMTGQNGTAYSGDGGGGGAGGGGYYGGAGQSSLTQTGFTASQAYGGANYTNTSGRNSFATYIGTSGNTQGGGGTGGSGTTTTINNSSNFNYSSTYGKGGNAQGNGGTSTTANGNNGIVIIRYPGSALATGGTVTQSGGYTLHTFSSVGSNTFTANSGNSVCAGSTTTLNCATAGGVWSSSDTSIVSIDASTGLVTGKVAGTVTITYTVTNAQGCVGSSTKQFTVNPLPTVPAITGNTTMCDNTTTLLSNTLIGGVWSSSLTAKAIVNASTGLVTSVALGSGSTTISYLYTDNNGCSNTNSTVVTINASPTIAAITGNAGVCIGSTTTFSNVTLNGTWTSNNTNAATINSSGLITTVAVGSSIISYTVINASACATVVTKSITVNALPNVTANATATTVCFGTQTNLTGGNASSYTWNNGVTNNVAFAPSATNTYTVTGTDGNGCVKTADITITVNNLPIVSISPSVTTLCNGYSSTLTASGASTYGWTIVGSTPYLDQVSSTTTLKLAAGLHKLKSSYSGSAIRIRRSSDNTEADFGFSGNDLDVASISIFIGAGTAFVKTLYDQSGNGNHLSQTSTGNQPTLTLSGLNGKPVIHTNTSQNIYTSTNFPTPYSIVYGARQTGGSRGRVLADWGGNNWLLGYWNGYKGSAHFGGWVGPSAGTAAADNNVYIYTGTATGSNSSFAYQNGTNITVNSAGGNSGPNGLTMNRWQNCCEPSDADFTDLIEFNSVLSTNDRQTVENGIGAYYGLAGFYNTTGASTTVTPNTTSSFTVYGTDGNGCIGTATQAITVNPKPNAGTDVNYLCGGATQTLTGTANTGTWTALSTNPTGATLSSTTSGVATVAFTNFASGTFSFIYTLPTTNCSDTMSITVRPKPNAGVDKAVCILNAATGVSLTSNITGVWSAMSSNAGTASIVSASSASTQVNNFSLVGDYNFINTNNGCTDTTKVTVTPAGSIGNYVWKDQNNDGLQNEPTSNGVNNITVELYKKDGNGTFNLYTSTITTDNSGNPGYYNFGICEDGVYKIKVPTVNPFTQTHLTAQDATANADGNSDINPTDGLSPEITIDTYGSGVAKDNNTIDAGYQICTKPIAGADFNTCGGQFITITGVSTTPALPTTDGNWAVLSSNPSGAILSATNLGVATIQFDSLAAGIYKFVYTVTGGCDDTLNIAVGAKPAAGSDLSEICGGSIIPVIGLPIGGTWSQASANASGATVGATSNGVANISFANLISGTYTFVYTTPFGCSDTMTISTKPKPNAGNDVYMECGTQRLFDSLSATPIGGVWTALSTNNNLVTLGSTTASAKARINLPLAPNQGNWSFIYTATNGCTDTMRYVIGVVGNPAPSINGGSNPICGTNTLQLCPTVWGWSNFQWYKNGVAISGQRGASSCITIDTSSLGSYTLSGSNGSNCWSIQSTPIVVYSSAPATPTIITSGSTTVCAGNSATLTSSATNGNQWKKDGAVINGATSQTYTANASGVYTATVTGICGSTTSAGTTVTVNAAITVAAIVASSNSVCMGTTITLTNATNGGVWSSSNTAIATINSSGIVTPISDGTVTFNYTVTVSDCSKTVTYNVTVPSGGIPAATTIVAQSSTTLCGTNTVQLCPSVYGWSNYQWYKNGVAVTTNGASACIVIDTAKLGSYTLSVTTGTCWSPQSNAITTATASAPATPTISASGSTSICNGASVTLTSSATTGNQWKKDGIAISGATSQTYSATASGVYTVTVTNCGSTTSAGTTVTVASPITVAAIAGTSNVCLGSSTTLTNATTGGVWSTSNNARATVNSNGVVTGLSTGSVIITYTVTISGCSSSASYTLNVANGSNISAPSIAAQGSTGLCGNSTAQICPTVWGWSNYQWYKNGVAVTTNGASACIVIDTAKLGSYTLSVTTGTCWSPQSNAITIATASAPATPTISASGSTSICNGASVTLTSSATTGNQWKKDGIAISGATSQTYSAIASGVYTVTVTDCGTATSAGTTVTVAAPITVASITSSSSTICIGNSITMSNATTGGVWSSSNTAVATVNASGIVTSTAAGTTTITYTKTVSGCSNSETYSLTVQGSSAVTTPTLDVRGSTAICGSGSLQLCPQSWGYSNYQWYKDGVAYSTSACITVNTAGAYTLTGTNGSGCWSAQSAPAVVTLNPIPTMVATTGPIAVCAGSSITLVNISTIPSGGTGVWISVAGRANIASTTGVVTGTSAGTATMVYTVTSSVGCKASTSYNVVVNAIPATPTIAFASGTSGITGSGGYCANRTFTLLGTPSGGTWNATGAFSISSGGVVTTSSTSGSGSVTYTYVNGCPASRTIPANVINCGSKGVVTNNTNSNSTFIIYPNPIHSLLNIKLDKLVGSGKFVVTDLYGKTVKQQSLSMGTNTFDVSNLAKGMYLVSIITEQGKESKKIIVE